MQPLAVTPSESKNDSDLSINALGNRFAYLWADQPTAAIGAPYTPFGAYNYNAKGLTNTVTHSTLGLYLVTLGGMAKGGVATKRETIIVTPYGNSPNRCIVGGWGDNGTNLNVSVLCVNAAGAASDSYFTLLMVGQGSLPGRYAFAWASQPTVASYAPDTRYAFTKSGGAMTLSRAFTGVYRADLASVRPAGGPPETYLLSVYGNRDDQCSIVSWFTVANVGCYSQAAAGAASDAQYEILTLTKGRPGRRAAFAWADNSTIGAYTPNPSYAFSSSGGAITITRASTGNYTVNFAGLQKLSGHTETVQVSNYSTGFHTCRVRNWQSSAVGLSVNVICVNVNGTPIDSYYTIAVLE